MQFAYKIQWFETYTKQILFSYSFQSQQFQKHSSFTIPGTRWTKIKEKGVHLPSSTIRIFYFSNDPIDFYNINIHMRHNSHQNNNILQDNKSTLITRQKDQKQKYIKKIKYQAHKLASFYNQCRDPPKTQNYKPYHYHSKIQIQTLPDLIISLDEILQLEQKLRKKMLSSPIHTCILCMSEVRLGLKWDHVHDSQVVRELQNTQGKSEALGSQDYQNKSVELQKRSSKKIFKIDCFSLPQWLKSKLFTNNNQVFYFSTLSQQQKYICFFKNQKLDFVEISSNQYLVHSAIIQEQRDYEARNKQTQLFDSLFGTLFVAHNNFKVSGLSDQKIKQILSFLQRSSPKMQESALKNYYQFLCDESNLTGYILQEKRQRVKEFLLDYLKKKSQKNVQKPQFLGSRSFKQDRSAQNLSKSYTEKVMQMSEQPDLLNNIQTANQGLRDNSFFSLMGPWKWVLRQKIQHILNNFQIYQVTLKDHLLLFARLHELNLMRIEQYLKNHVLSKLLNQKLEVVYETIYPHINSVVSKILQKLGAQTLHFFLQKFKKLNEKRYLNPNQIHSQFIALMSRQLNCSQTNQNQRQFLQSVREMFVAYAQNPKQNNSESSSQSYFQNIHNQRIMNNSCLGCTNFFYQNFNIYQPSLTQAPLKIFKDINELKDSNTGFVDSICGMLNSRGGIILFGFQQKLGQAKPCGKIISQKLKEILEHRILATMNLMYPKVEQKDWIFNFVPIYENPLLQNPANLKMVKYKGYQQLMKPNQSFLERNILKGIYIGRITVRPTDLTKLYMFSFKKQKVDEKYYASKFENGEIKQIPLRNLRKILRKSIKAKHREEELRAFQNTSFKRSGFFGHECLPPEGGKQIAEGGQTGRAPYKKQSYVQMLLNEPAAKPKSHPVSNKQVNL